MKKTMYHGTNSEYLEKIQEQGLKNPFLTDVLEIAGEYALATSGYGEPIVIKLSDVDSKNFIVDRNSLYEPVGYSKRTSKKMDEMISDLAKRVDITPNDWKYTFPITKTVQYIGVIPGSKIKEVKEIQWDEF